MKKPEKGIGLFLHGCCFIQAGQEFCRKKMNLFLEDQNCIQRKKNK